MTLIFCRRLGKVSFESAGEVLRDHLRGMVRQMITDVIAEEVTELCGPKHQPTGGDMYRAGTAPGRVIYEGRREAVVRPRVRQRRGQLGRRTDGRLARVDHDRPGHARRGADARVRVLLPDAHRTTEGPAGGRADPHAGRPRPTRRRLAAGER